MSKSLKCLTFCNICLLLLSIIFIGLAIAMPYLFNYGLLYEIKKQLIMTPDNYDLWGKLPGKTKVPVVRNFTFYNITNSWDVVFRKKTPIY